MGLAARRERERFEIREKIIDAARKLIASEGYEGVSMRKIAALIEYSPTIIYSHFSDKQNLLSALVDEDYLSLGERMYQHADVQDPLQRLHLMGQEVVNFAIENPNHYRIIALTPRSPSHRPTLSVVKQNDDRKDVHAFIIQCVCEAIQQGLLRTDLQDAELVSQTFYAGIHGVIALYLEHDQDEWLNWRPIQQRVNLMIDLMIRGLTDCQASI